MIPVDDERPRDGTDPPGAVSNQNQEEAEAGLAEGGGDQAPDGGHGAGGKPNGGHGAGGKSGDSVPGAASEGSQATGHPENAG